MKKIIFGIIIGIMLGSGIVYAATLYKANDISYTPSDESWEVSNVNDALNSLYSMKTEENTLKGTVHTAVFTGYTNSKTQSYTIEENGIYILSICSTISIVSSSGSVSITVNDNVVSYTLNQSITDPDKAFKLCYALSDELELNKGDVIKFITTGTKSYSTKGQIGTVIKL